MPRFSISTLLALVALTAAAFASLRDGGSRAWDFAWLGALVLALTLAVLLAVHRRGKARAFWLGFALFGWVEFGLIQHESLRARLPTTQVLIALAHLYPVQVADLRKLPDKDRASFLNPYGTTRDDVVLGIEGGSGRLLGSRGGVKEPFYPIGHSILAFLIAVVGGFASRRLRRPDEQPGNQAETASK